MVMGFLLVDVNGLEPLTLRTSSYKFIKQSVILKQI